MRLGALAKAKGYRLEAFSSLASTNDTALARGRESDSGRLWIIAEEQTSGRGRMARPWTSPPGNLYASVLLVNPAPQRLSPQLGFVAGVSLADAVNDGTPFRARLKWPNDLLIDGAKVSGILVESTNVGGRFLCSIGFGVNCISHPPDTPYPATHLAAHAGAVSVARLAERLTDALSHWLDVWSEGRGFDAIRTAWLERALPFGSPLRVELGADMRQGAFGGIDPQGRLILECGNDVITFDAGDVFPAGAYETKREI